MDEEKNENFVLAGSPVVVTFNGRDYTWHQRPRREQREVRNRMMHILAHLGGIDGLKQKSEVGLVASSLEAVNHILNFCEDFNPDMRDRMDEIEDCIRRDPAAYASIISDVFVPLFDKWVKPWLNFDAKKKAVATTDTPSPEPTKQL